MQLNLYHVKRNVNTSCYIACPFVIYFASKLTATFSEWKLVSQIVFIGLSAFFCLFVCEACRTLFSWFQESIASQNHPTLTNAEIPCLIDSNTHPCFDRHSKLPCVFIGSPKQFGEFHWLVLYCNITIELFMNPRTNTCFYRKSKLTCSKDIQRLIDSHFLVNVGTSTKSLQDLAQKAQELIEQNPIYKLGSWDCQSFAWYVLNLISVEFAMIEF